MESRILAYVDSRLKENERLEMEKHLETCAACRLRVNEFRGVAGLLEELPQVEPSPAFDVRVRARVAAEPVKKSWWAWLAPSPRVAFAASMLLVATVWIASRPGAQQMATNQPAPEAEYQMIKDLPVLEDYDVLSNFEPMTDLPAPVQAENSNQQM